MLLRVGAINAHTDSRGIVVKSGFRELGIVEAVKQALLFGYALNVLRKHAL